MQFSILRLMVLTAMIAGWACVASVVYRMTGSQGRVPDYVFAGFMGFALPALTGVVGAALWSVSGAIEAVIRKSGKGGSE